MVGAGGGKGHRFSVTVGNELCAGTDFLGEVSHGVSHSVSSPIQIRRGLGTSFIHRAHVKILDVVVCALKLSVGAVETGGFLELARLQYSLTLGQQETCTRKEVGNVTGNGQHVRLHSGTHTHTHTHTHTQAPPDKKNKTKNPKQLIDGLSGW